MIAQRVQEFKTLADVLPFKRPQTRFYTDDFDPVDCLWQIVNFDNPDEGFLVAEKVPFKRDYFDHPTLIVTRDIPEAGWLQAVPCGLKMEMPSLEVMASWINPYLID